MSGAQDSNGEAKVSWGYTPSVVVSAKQARALVSILEAFDTGDEVNPAHVTLWVDSNPDLTVTVHAALSPDTPENEIEVCVVEDGRIYGYECETEVTRWLAPVRVAEFQRPGPGYDYAGGLICYRTTALDAPSIPPEASS